MVLTVREPSSCFASEHSLGDVQYAEILKVFRKQIQIQNLFVKLINCAIFFVLRMLVTYLSPFTGDTSSPEVSRGNALILVHTSHHKLGALCPKFSGLQVVPATFFPFGTLFI